MSEMVKRVAKAMDAADKVWAMDESSPDFYETMARAVIEEMLVPTKAMLEALNECGGDTEAIWPAMIAAALKDE